MLIWGLPQWLCNVLGSPYQVLHALLAQSRLQDAVTPFDELHRTTVQHTALTLQASLAWPWGLRWPQLPQDELPHRPSLPPVPGADNVCAQHDVLTMQAKLAHGSPEIS